MKSAFRLLLYVALLLSAVVCFNKFAAAYRQPQPAVSAELTANLGDPAVTNEPAAALGEPTATNAVATNLAVTATSLAGSNVMAALPAGITNANANGALANGSAAPRPVQRSDSFVWLGLFIFTLLALGCLAAWDFSRYLGGRTQRSMLATDFLIPTDPDYENAESEWAKGNHLDALNLMRDYLKRNPNEQHVAIRIAEIYEKDLNNYLAAALELEEVLTKKLPREKWGWTAVHLANLYSGKLKQSAKALGVLERIVKDYPDTGAAKKARQRLGLPEPEAASATDPAPGAAEAGPAEAAEPEPPSNLPKGFRAKK